MLGSVGKAMNLITEVEKPYTAKKLPEIRPGDTVRVHLRIREGNKERVQVFEGLVIRRKNGEGISASITVRRISSGVGVERTFLLYSPQIVRIQITKRTKVRRALLSYMRGRTGKSSRLQEKRFDRVDMTMEEPEVAKEPEVPGETAPAEEVALEAPAAETSETPGEPTEAEVTEINPEDANEPEVVESTEELAEAENKEAAETADDSAPDENDLSAEETEEGVEEADSESTSPAVKEQLE
jgi:large subunit ribosomal protein L19